MLEPHSYNPFSLYGKIILVTGASSGIGRVTALECSKMGATIIITGRNEKRLEETFSLLDNKSNQNHKLVLSDLTDDTQISKLIDEIEVLDGMSSNIGVNRIKPITYLKTDDIDYIYKNNLYSNIQLTSQLLKKKKFRGNSSLVFTSSVSSFFNAPGRSLYSSSKAALASFVRSVAIEQSGKKIRANSIHPGMVETNMILATTTEEERLKDMATYPLKRYGRPEEIAWATVYLLSDASSWVTGTSLTIDGGFMLK